MVCWVQVLISAELTILRDKEQSRIPLKLAKPKNYSVDILKFAQQLDYATQIESDGNLLTIKTNPPILIRANNPFIKYGPKTIQLKRAVIKEKDSYWVPLDWAIAFFQSISVEKFVYHPNEFLLEVQPAKVVWNGITLNKINDTQAQLEIHLPRGPQLKAAYQDSTLTIEVYGATTQAKNFKLKAPPGFLASNKLLLEKQPHVIYLKFQSKILNLEPLDSRSYKITILPKSHLQDTKDTLQKVDEKKTFTSSSEEKNLTNQLKDAQKKWLIDCIVIDAGHGGRDPGAIGNKLQEKVITLDIALRLKKILSKEPNLRIVMTRETDVFVPLQERTKIANRENGKLFISIHANAARNKKVRGIETYFLSPARTEKALEVAELENRVIRLEQDTSIYQKLTDENFILLTMAQSQFVRESQELAFLVQRNAVKRLGLEDRGVDQAGFYVLVGASMPAILFETAFISNPQDAKVLRSESARQAYAEALAKAIIEFCQRVNSKGQ